MTQPHPVILSTRLNDSAVSHRHLCPRQVLGVRMGLYALCLLGFPCEDLFHNTRKRLITFVETDGCGADGIASAVDCSIGHRTLHVEDYGKMAATFVDSLTERAIRIRPRAESRQLAQSFPVDAKSRWHKYLEAYQHIHDEDLLDTQEVTLRQPLRAVISKPQSRAICQGCGEEIMNEREIVKEGRPYCRACSGQGYYVVESAHQVFNADHVAFSHEIIRVNE